MKILLDECIDWRLKFEFVGHHVITVQEMNWLGKKNGELMKLASEEGFIAFVTIDKRLKHQQNLSKYTLSVIVPNHPRTTLSYLKQLVPKTLVLLETIKPGEAYEIE